jgi:hypothetical protein
VDVRARTKVLIKTRLFTLTEHKKADGGEKFYTVSSSKFNSGNHIEIRKHFDPASNRGSRTGDTWKFRNRKEAEQLITMAIMRFEGK